MLNKQVATFALACFAGLPAFAAPPVPRPANEFTIVQPSGAQSLLSSYRGKVVLVQFLYTTCGHCQATARTFTKLQTELGPRGLQVLGVAFNPEAQGRPDIVGNFIKSNSIGFPVGTSSLETVLSYPRVSVADRFMVPQIVVIDRNGMIRAQSESSGSAELQDESYMRSLLDRLLNETKTSRVRPVK